jgi:hypothetical protein
MASKSPIVRQVAWLSLLPQLALIACIIVFARFIGFQNYVFSGAIIYLMVSFLIRIGILLDHRKSIAILKITLQQAAGNALAIAVQEGVI